MLIRLAKRLPSSARFQKPTSPARAWRLVTTPMSRQTARYRARGLITIIVLDISWYHVLFHVQLNLFISSTQLKQSGIGDRTLFGISRRISYKLDICKSDINDRPRDIKWNPVTKYLYITFSLVITLIISVPSPYRLIVKLPWYDVYFTVTLKNCRPQRNVISRFYYEGLL